MADSLFVLPAPALTLSRVGSASDETGLVPGDVVADSDNEGALQIRTSGIPSAVNVVDVALVSGGIATGPTTMSEGVPGATFRYKLDTAGVTEWEGYVWPAFLRDVRVMSLATATAIYPHVAGVRRLGNGKAGMVRILSGISQVLQFRYKNDRRASWTTVTVESSVSILHRPAWVVLPTGRILIFGVMDGATVVRAWKSDDHGVTWSVWSYRTGITADGSGGALSAELVNDALLVVAGSSEVYTVGTTSAYWSADGGQNFTLGGSVGSSLFLTGATVVSSLGLAMYVVAVDDGVGATTGVSVYPIAYGGGFGEAIVTLANSVNRTNAIVSACALDDGTLWIMRGNTTYPAQAYDTRVSLDGGLTWVPPGGDSSAADTVLYTTHSSGGYRGIALGCFEGALVAIARTDTGIANEDNSVHEWWFGGYDQLTETDTGGTSNGARNQAAYYGENGAVFVPTDLPDSLGWTKTDTGAGATVATSTAGINIVSTFANNSVYTSPSAFFSPDSADSVRLRWRTLVNSGGDVSADVAYVMIAIGDGVNRQWIKIRFAANQARALDETGTLWTSAVSASFGTETEWMLAFAHDYPAAGGGQAALRYRHAASDAWVTAFEAQAIGEQAGTATEVIAFGGTSVVSQSDWSIVGPWFAYGSDSLDAAYTNPGDLDGRPVCPFVDVQLVNNISLGGSGDAGVVGDAYTITPAYSRGAKNLLRSLRPSCYAETSVANANATYVLGDGTMAPIGDFIALIGTNYRTATFEFSNTDSWATPAYTANLDATLYASTVATGAAGSVVMTGGAMIPHRYRTTPNRRYFLALKASSTEVYEILDNDETRVYVTGLGSGYAGERAWIFGDRMAAVIPKQALMYVRIYIPAQATVESTFRTGTPWIGTRHPISIAYDNGFVDSWEPNYTEWTTDAGLRQAARRGGETHLLRIAWGAMDRLTVDYAERVTRLFRALDGLTRPVLFWRDPNDIGTLGLYTVEGPPSTENSYGEGRNAFERIPQVILREYR